MLFTAVAGAVVVFFHPESKFFGNVINTAHRPRITAEKSPEGEERAFKSSKALDSRKGVRAARGVEFTARGKERRDEAAIEADKRKKDEFHFFLPPEDFW